VQYLVRTSRSKTASSEGEQNMIRTWMAMLVVAGGLNPAMYGQQYPQQYPAGQVDPNVNRPDPYNQYDYGQYPDGAYEDIQGDYAPTPPPIPSYAYPRPPMPGPGYYWVDGYWNFTGGRYSWIRGYWTLPPYAGGYWVTPRYSGGRYFRGFWGGARRGFDRGFVRDGYRNRGYVPPRQRSYGSEFRGDRYRDPRPNDRGRREGRR
jgi:hypothetical protein